MGELMAAGGCYNSMRYCLDGAGQGARNWRADVNASAQMTQLMRLILAVCFDADDMNDAENATFKIQWANNTDAPTTWYDLSNTGEIRYIDDTDLIDENLVIEAEDSGGNTNCTGKGWSRADGMEVSGKNGIVYTVGQDYYFDFHWAITLANADYVNGDSYSFRVCQADDVVIGTMIGLLTVVRAGKIEGITKNKDRTSPVVGVTVTALPSDEAGSDPKILANRGFVAQIVSDGATGAFSLVGDLVSGDKYFLHFYKDAAEDLSDGTPEVIAVDYP